MEASMYQATENMQYWIAMLNMGEKLEIDSEVPSPPNATLFEYYDLHDPRDLQDALDDKYESFSSLSVADDEHAWLAHHMSSSGDSGDSTTTSATSDGDIVTTCSDAAWHSLPAASIPLSSSPPHDYYSCACSQDVHQALAQQGFLLSVFHEELRRIIPSDQDYSTTWLEDVDPDLVLAPVQSYENLCWRSAVSDTHTTAHSQHEPIEA